MCERSIDLIKSWMDSIKKGLGPRDRPRCNVFKEHSPVSQVRFNQLFEIPKLDKWFKADPSPSRQKLLNYMNILNGSSFRRNHQKISYQQICNWFANQRASNRRPALAATQSQINQQVPSMPTMLTDFRPKFDFNNLIESCQKSTNGDDSRIDGGSDSPTPNDDEVHSNSDGANEMMLFPHMKQESTASSPDLSMHITNSLASSSPKHMPTDMTMGNGMNGMGLGSQAARSRLMFDPLTELPILEKWFEENPHPTWMQIDQYTQMLNSCPYRENYPHISQHNVKIWFKNRRAKCKRMQTGMVEKLEKLFA
uniref:Homeobox domain-containing protein n=1 Tax=Heterorhabditis bacteriophora TaxID=37862 RepID=A0A1I7XVX2_HETBA